MENVGAKTTGESNRRGANYLVNPNTINRGAEVEVKSARGLIMDSFILITNSSVYTIIAPISPTTLSISCSVCPFHFSLVPVQVLRVT